ncbi:MAG TPA: glycosyltransferase family 39 protein [Solirubrobacterales bacterium]|nr:glycosyltransferase family 39 protein [Solirubrobacterales bacterium]
MKAESTDSRRRLAPAAIVILALVLRIAVVAADSGYRPTNDAFEYDHYGRSIAAGEGFGRSGYLLQGGPAAIRGPGYPYLLGAVYAASGDSRDAARIVNALLGALTVLLVYLIAKRVWGRRTGLVAAGLTAAFPPLVLLSRDLVSESLFIPLELGAVLCVLEFRRSGRDWRWALAAGAFCGLATLTRNTGLILLLPIAVGLWGGSGRPLRASLAAPAVAVATLAVVIAPWLIRDAAQFGRFVPVTTSNGIALSGTYNQASYTSSGTHGAWRTPQIVPEFTHLFVEPGRNEADVDQILRREALSFAWDHPGYVAGTSLWNVLRLFEVTGGSVVEQRGHAVDDRGIGSATPPAERIGLAIAVFFGLLGAIALLRSRAAARRGNAPPRLPTGPAFLWLVPAVMLAVAIPVAGVPRYRLPADPFLMMLAAIGMLWLLDTYKQRAKTT